MEIAAAGAAEWQVLLGGQFRSYDADVQRELEAAFADGKDEAEVWVRGCAYVVKGLLGSEASQVQKLDASRARRVRRTRLATRSAFTSVPKTRP